MIGSFGVIISAKIRRSGCFHHVLFHLLPHFVNAVLLPDVYSWQRINTMQK